MKTMKLTILYALLLGTISANADSICFPKINQQQFEEVVTFVKEEYFPELKKISIGVSTFTSDAYFLQAQPEIRTIIKKRNKRHYNVQLNTKLLECPPSPAALEAIIVHEFEHIVDYTKWSFLRIFSHGTQYVTSCGTKARYERATDAKVLSKGLFDGLIEYRNWVYQWLTPEELKTKRKIYLTPEEIREIQIKKSDQIKSL